MRDLNATLVGNATRDPQKTVHADGGITATVRVAVNGRYFDRSSGSFEDRKAEFVTIYARRALARNLLTSIHKGDPVIATGRLGTSEWKRDDGTTEHTLTLQAEMIGPDLSFGTCVYSRTPRRGPDPELDERTGEILTETELPAEGPGDSDEQRDFAVRSGAELTAGSAERELEDASPPF